MKWIKCSDRMPSEAMYSFPFGSETHYPKFATVCFYLSDEGKQPENPYIEHRIFYGCHVIKEDGLSYFDSGKNQYPVNMISHWMALIPPLEENQTAYYVDGNLEVT